MKNDVEIYLKKNSKLNNFTKNTNKKYKSDINGYLKEYFNKKPCKARIGGAKSKKKYYVTICEYEEMLKLIPKSCPNLC